MKLAALQSNFQNYLLENASPTSSLPHMQFLEAMVNDKQVGIQKRLNIYHHAYRARMVEALATVYPNLMQWLGCEAFNQTVIAYLGQHPSTFRNLRWFGDHMADYIGETMPEDIFAADLARFEWALSIAFDAADEPVLSLEALGQIPPEQWSSLCFDWNPAVQVFSAQTNVIPAWQALDAGEAPEVTSQSTRYIVWRQDMMSYFKTLDEQEEKAIKFMMDGHSFGDLCDALAAFIGEDQAMPTAASYLSEWLTAGMLLKSSLNK